MGLISGLLDALFGEKSAALVDALRRHGVGGLGSNDNVGVLARLIHEKRGHFDRAIDGVNRLPRPALALGCLALIGAAMIAPNWFAERMASVALMPEPLWWLMGAVVSFYFGARHQAKGQEFQRSLALVAAAGPAVSGAPSVPDQDRQHDGSDGREPAPNGALTDWQTAR